MIALSLRFQRYIKNKSFYVAIREYECDFETTASKPKHRILHRNKTRCEIGEPAFFGA